MNLDSLRTDVRYAIGQIRRLLPSGSVHTEDACCRALDALERVRAELGEPETDEERIARRLGCLRVEASIPSVPPHAWTAAEILAREG